MVGGRRSSDQIGCEMIGCFILISCTIRDRDGLTVDGVEGLDYIRRLIVCTGTFVLFCRLG